jgi:hypothetical protein
MVKIFILGGCYHGKELFRFQRIKLQECEQCKQRIKCNKRKQFHKREERKECEQCKQRRQEYKQGGQFGGSLLVTSGNAQHKIR